MGVCECVCKGDIEISGEEVRSGWLQRAVVTEPSLDVLGDCICTSHQHSPLLLGPPSINLTHT